MTAKTGAAKGQHLFLRLCMSMLYFDGLISLRGRDFLVSARKSPKNRLGEALSVVSFMLCTNRSSLPRHKNALPETPPDTLRVVATAVLSKVTG